MRVLIFLVAVATVLWIPAWADESKPDAVQAELQKWQGLWQRSPGGMVHQDGDQVVRLPALDGPCFFVCGNRLIWLDGEGKPSGVEERIKLDVEADPKRVTFTPVEGDQDGRPTHGIYSATGSTLTVHLGLDGGPAPKQFLELNKPARGVDGREWLVHRKKLQEK